jgi:hypothetical protein
VDKKPPEKHRVRGLNFKNLTPEMQNEVKEIVQIVLQSDCRIDLQIRDSYLNVYYKGGCLWKVSRISPRSRGLIIETDPKYIILGTGSLSSFQIIIQFPNLPAVQSVDSNRQNQQMGP